MKVSLMISTYNTPQYLRLTLSSVMSQTVMPDEVIIADDGSGEETRVLIQEMRVIMSVPLVHVWHEDKGFRLAGIRNKAIKASTCDYIIQIDGDIVLDKHFIEDHKRYAKQGYYCTGSRAMVSKELTETAILSGYFLPQWYSAGIKHRLNALRCPFLVSHFHNYRRINGCNMAFWKKDLYAVNGYNEDIVGWGYEDNDIAERIERLGIRKRHIKFSAIEYHLWHKESPRNDQDSNRRIVERNRDTGIIKCPKGLVNIQ